LEPYNVTLQQDRQTRMPDFFVLQMGAVFFNADCNKHVFSLKS